MKIRAISVLLTAACLWAVPPVPLASAAKARTAVAAGSTANTNASSSVTLEMSSPSVALVTVEAAVTRKKQTFNALTYLEGRWEVTTSGCVGPTLRGPSAIYPVPSPTLVAAPTTKSACVKGQTITTFYYQASSNAAIAEKPCCQLRVKTGYRLDLPKGSKVVSISTSTLVTESQPKSPGSTSYKVTSSTTLSATSKT